MTCPKCNGYMEPTQVLCGTGHEVQQRCLNCGLYIRDTKERHHVMYVEVIHVVVKGERGRNMRNMKNRR